MTPNFAQIAFSLHALTGLVGRQLGYCIGIEDATRVLVAHELADTTNATMYYLTALDECGERPLTQVELTQVEELRATYQPWHTEAVQLLGVEGGLLYWAAVDAAPAPPEVDNLADLLEQLRAGDMSRDDVIAALREAAVEGGE